MIAQVEEAAACLAVASPAPTVALACPPWHCATHEVQAAWDRVDANPLMNLADFRSRILVNLAEIWSPVPMCLVAADSGIWLR